MAEQKCNDGEVEVTQERELEEMKKKVAELEKKIEEMKQEWESDLRHAAVMERCAIQHADEMVDACKVIPRMRRRICRQRRMCASGECQRMENDENRRPLRH